MQCPSCKRPHTADALYCSHCGVRLTSHGAAEEEDRPWPSAEGERRQLTVMFCDLVDSTPLGERLDPEDLRGLLGVYQDTCSRIIAKYEGRVAQYLGDGVLVYFSYPQAHEDDAERAVRAGLEIVEAIGDAGPGLERDRGASLEVRVGIHTGPVLVGELSRAQRGGPRALGHAVNVAARLEDAASPGCVVISADTLRLVQGLFVTEDLGALRLKGIADPVAAHRVVRPSGVRSRLDVAVATGLTPLVGRDQDLAVLIDRWDRVREGQGQVVLVSGEAGIGKSRLMRALRDRLAEEPHTWLECRGSPHHPHSALHPVIELLRQGLRFSEDLSPEEQIERIESSIGAAGMDLPGIRSEEAVALIAGLMSVQVDERHALPELSRDAQRRGTLETLNAWLLSLARLQPTVMVVEDLHWTDPSTLELLGALIDRVAAAPLLLLPTFRPSFEHWVSRPHVSCLFVQPLTRRQTASMVEAIAGDSKLPAETIDQVVRKTDGIPLFVEELTKSVLEAGPRLDPAIPATLQDSLMARLDRLGPAKKLAQLGAVLGRDFSHELLAAVSKMEKRSLDDGLKQLRDAALVYERGEPPDVSYTFKHAMVQEVAYGSLLKETRRECHARIARLLEVRERRGVATRPEEIARHFEGGALYEKAVSYYQRAGELATERSAHAEAIGHLTRGIQLVRSLPAGRGRDEREVTLQVSLGAAIAAAKGWGTRDAEKAYDRARTLCERLGETPQLFPVIRGLVAFYTARAEFDPALELCGRLVRLAERGGESSELLLANHQMGVVHYFRGDPSVSLEHYERALGHYDASRHRSLAAAYQADPGVFVRIWSAWPLWMLGLPDRALARSREGIDLARDVGHPFSLGYALLWTAVLHLWRRERKACGQLAEEAIEIGREQAFPFVLAGGRITRSVSRMEPSAPEAAVEAAIADFELALTDFGNAGSEGAGRPHILGQLADAFAGVGRSERARAAVEAAIAFSGRTSQHYWDAELHRLKGELLAQGASARDEAERHLRLALELSKKQRAKMLELRAAASLNRFSRGRADRDESRALLAEVCDSFSEGLDTEDLVEARALLEA